MIAATIGYSLGLCTVGVRAEGRHARRDTDHGLVRHSRQRLRSDDGAMMADVGDQVRLEQGKERMALIFAITGLANKLAAAAAVGISYTLLAAVGYVPTLGVHNTPAAMNGLTWVLSPARFSGCCLAGSASSAGSSRPETRRNPRGTRRARCADGASGAGRSRNPVSLTAPARSAA